MLQVHYNGICYRLRVKPGPEGFASFNRQLQRITGLPVLDCMQITFQCRAPETSQELSFKGITAFDAGAFFAGRIFGMQSCMQKHSSLPSAASHADPFLRMRSHPLRGHLCGRAPGSPEASKGGGGREQRGFRLKRSPLSGRRETTF